MNLEESISFPTLFWHHSDSCFHLPIQCFRLHNRRKKSDFPLREVCSHKTVINRFLLVKAWGVLGENLWCGRHPGWLNQSPDTALWNVTRIRPQPSEFLQDEIIDMTVRNRSHKLFPLGCRRLSLPLLRRWIIQQQTRTASIYIWADKSAEDWTLVILQLHLFLKHLSWISMQYQSFGVFDVFPRCPRNSSKSSGPRATHLGLLLKRGLGKTASALPWFLPPVWKPSWSLSWGLGRRLCLGHSSPPQACSLHTCHWASSAEHGPACN